MKYPVSSFSLTVGKRGKKKSPLGPFSLWVLALCWKVPMGVHFWCCRGKPQAAFPVTKQTRSLRGLQTQVRKVGPLCFSRQGVHGSYPRDLPSFPALSSAAGLSAQRAPHQSVADGQRSSTEPVFLWTCSRRTCFPAGDQSVLDGSMFASTNELDPLPSTSANLWKKESVSILFGGEGKKPASLHTAGDGPIHANLRSRCPKESACRGQEVALKKEHVCVCVCSHTNVINVFVFLLSKVCAHGIWYITSGDFSLGSKEILGFKMLTVPPPSCRWGQPRDDAGKTAAQLWVEVYYDE